MPISQNELDEIPDSVPEQTPPQPPLGEAPDEPLLADETCDPVADGDSGIPEEDA